MPFDGVEVSEVTERLVIGRARIEAGWCQGHLYRTRWTLHGARPKYCLVGAVRGEPTTASVPNMALDLVIIAIRELGYGLIQPSIFNDTHTKAEVLKVVDLAIAMSRGQVARPDSRSGKCGINYRHRTLQRSNP